MSVYGSITLVNLGRFFSFLSTHTRQDSLDGGSARRKAATYTQTFMPRVGFEHMIPVSERAKTVPALARAATVIGGIKTYISKLPWYSHQDVIPKAP
jgi:hypothetical protein